ncbi:MAG: hypothetical protein MJ138_05335 [Kiritimatiellae bacterium]|nr:hypothetical protein [Kiritimatiellia bacterium]
MTAFRTRRGCIPAGRALMATLPLAAAALSALADGPNWVRESELAVAGDLAVPEASEMVLDLRTVFPVAKLKDEPALRNFAYSAVGWGLDPVSDATRTVTITAQSGTLANGAFSSDGSAAATVLAATTGRGTADWNLQAVSKKVCRLSHVVRKNGTPDESATLIGFLDFTHVSDAAASQQDVEAAVLAAVTHEIAVVQDADAPWQPADSSSARSGLATDAGLAPGTRTATSFAFNGCGVLRYEYRLTGGTLEVSVDGASAESFSGRAAEWVPRRIAFAEHGAHEVVFAYTAAGGGATAAIRDVRWEEPDRCERAFAGEGKLCFDLAEGVRTPRRLRDVLPFEYSSTNWIGDVAGVGAASVAKVTVVALAGTDPDVRNWTDEVPGTSAELVKRSGEDSVKWKPAKGVWKATFDVLNDGTGVHRETALFDLRDSRGGGFALILK